MFQPRLDARKALTDWAPWLTVHIAQHCVKFPATMWLECLETPDPSPRCSNLQHSLSRLPPWRDSANSQVEIEGGKRVRPTSSLFCPDGRFETGVSTSPLWWVSTACMRSIVRLCCLQTLPSLHHQDTTQVHDAAPKRGLSLFRLSNFPPVSSTTKPKPSNPKPLALPLRFGGSAGDGLVWSRSGSFSVSRKPPRQTQRGSKLQKWGPVKILWLLVPWLTLSPMSRFTPPVLPCHQGHASEPA